MLVVIFEVTPTNEGKKEYLEIAATLRKFLAEQAGFISIERFQSLSNENKLLSLSFWEDEASVSAWRNLIEHRQAQLKGRQKLFTSYRIRVAEVCRDYTGENRQEAPDDSHAVL